VNSPLQQLSERIGSELEEIEHVAQRAEEGWRRFQESLDEYYLDGVALNLHGFYNGLERIFERVASSLDGAKPTGENWHFVLLQQMSREVKGIRPAVISEAVRLQLDEFRGFRHVVRNVYTFNFESDRVADLLDKLRPLFAQVQAELLAFAQFLEEKAG
jgi:hypothetical protein